ncbi:hypothetical protein KKE14_03175 [Patescibacteria group bacterium]|nr:hypothetical protein [Patescibacteria group bacterium]
MDSIITDSHDIARIRTEELEKLFINGRGGASRVRELTRRCYGDSSLRGMPESTRREIRARTKAAFGIAQEIGDFVIECGLYDEDYHQGPY